MSWVYIAVASVVVSAGSAYTSNVSARKARKAQELMASKQAAREKEQLLKEEKALEESQISAKQKGLQERRARSIRRGRSSTIIAGKGVSPNLTQLGQVRKKELGSGA